MWFQFQLWQLQLQLHLHLRLQLALCYLPPFRFALPACLHFSRFEREVWRIWRTYCAALYARPQLKKANLIACPGCFATAAALALLPFANYIDGAIIVDAKSGVSGAGKRTDREDLLYAEQHGNFKAYAIGGHRHLPEMVQTLADGGLPKADITFVPHLLPAARGIYLSAYIPLKKNIPPPVQIAADYWRDEPFVSVRDYAPTLAQVVGSNRTRIGAMTAGNNKTAIVIAALDNLIKGAAGQAVQNMNIRFALPETAGLC